MSGRIRSRPWWRECERLGHFPSLKNECLGCAKEADLRFLEGLLEALILDKVARRKCMAAAMEGLIFDLPLQKDAVAERAGKWWLN